MRHPESLQPHPGCWFYLRNGLIGLFIVVLVLDTMPREFHWHDKVHGWIEPVLDKTGLWQNTWGLFAPMPSKINTAMSADILFSDGSLVEWVSPAPNAWSVWEKFSNFRWNEYYDTIRLNDYKEGWPALADWLAREYSYEHLNVTQVRLYRSWAMLDEASFQKKDPFPFSNRTMIYRKEYE